MVAVAKSLLGGLDTAVASTTKKDGSTPTFADTFQQVSANRTDQATKVRALQVVRTSRSSSGGRNASKSSSAVDLAEQVVTTKSGRTASAAKANGSTLDPVAARVADDETQKPVAGNAARDAGAVSASKAIVSKSDQTNLGAASNISKAAQNNISQTEPKDSAEMTGQAPAQAPDAWLDAEALGAGETVLAQTAACAVLVDGIAARVSGVQSGKSELQHTMALVGNAFGQATKPLLSAASTKTHANASDDETNGHTSNLGVAVPNASESALPVAVGPTGLDLPAQVLLQAALGKPDVNENADVPIQGQVGTVGASSSRQLASGRSVGKIGQGSATVSDARARKPTGRHADAVQDKTAAAGVTALGTIPTIVVTATTSASAVADPKLVAPVVIVSTSHASVAAAPSAPSVSALTSNALRDGNLGGNTEAPTVKVQAYVTSGATVNAPGFKAATAGPNQNDGLVVGSDKTTSKAVEDNVSEAVAAGSLVASDAPGIVAGGASLNQEGVIAAANSLLKSGQQRGMISGITPATKERKTNAMETKATAASGSVIPTEAGSIALPANPSIAASTATKPGSGEHQTSASNSGQSTVLPVGNVGGLGQVAQTQAAAIAEPIATSSAHAASTLVSGEALTSATSPNGLQNADHGLSPLAHTTLFATPTVLEVGVPDGTQGWLKIRAEIGEGGVVQASMSSSTHAGQDALRRDLPAIAAFLESEHMPVNLQVAHGTSAGNTSLADGSGLSQDAAFNLGSGLGQSLSQDTSSSAGSGQGEPTFGRFAGGNGSQQEEANRHTSASTEVGAMPARAGLAATDSEWSVPSAYGSGSSVNGGSWLNVIA